MTNNILDLLCQIFLHYDASSKESKSSPYATHRDIKGEKLLGLVLGDSGEGRNDRQRIAQSRMFYAKGTWKMTKPCTRLLRVNHALFVVN